MICPECGLDKNDNKICPECGYIYNIIENNIANNLENENYHPLWTKEQAGKLNKSELLVLFSELSRIKGIYDTKCSEEERIRKKINELEEEAKSIQTKISPISIVVMILSIMLIAGILSFGIVTLLLLVIIIPIDIIVVLVLDGLIFGKGQKQKAEKFREEKIKPLREELKRLEEDNKKEYKECGVYWAEDVVGMSIFCSNQFFKLNTIVGNGMAANLGEALEILNKNIN